MAKTELKRDELISNYLNTSDTFWDVYAMQESYIRRNKILELFRLHPGCKLPVNGHYQANMIDRDLKKLMAKGLIKRERDGSRYKTSSKRQTFLVLA